MKRDCQNIFDGLSQHLEGDLPSILKGLRLIQDKCLIRDLGDTNQIGSIAIPENVDHMRGVAHQGLWRLGEVVAIGPGDHLISWNDRGDGEFGEGWKHKLITTTCEACGGTGKRFDIHQYEELGCWRCTGNGQIPVVIEPQVAIGDRVLFERRKEADVYIEGQRYCLVFASQSIIGLVEE